MKTFEITIPVLNEERTLISQIEKLQDFIRTSFKYSEFYKISVVIADNGSTDGTNAISLQLVKQYKNLKYIRLAKKGVGLALKKSWSESEADVIGYMDLDFSTDLQHLNEVASLFVNDSIKVVNGTRLSLYSNVKGRKFIRSITSISFNKIIRAVFNSSFTDGMCGFKFLTRDTFVEYLSSISDSDGWFFATELLVAADFFRIPINELPVNWNDDPNSKVKILSLSMNYLRSIYNLKNKIANYDFK